MEWGGGWIGRWVERNGGFDRKLTRSVFQDLLERAEWGADLPSVENNLQTHHSIHTSVEELLHSLKEARNYEVHTHTHNPTMSFQ